MDKKNIKSFDIQKNNRDTKFVNMRRNNRNSKNKSK